MMPMRVHRKVCKMEKVEIRCRSATTQHAMLRYGITMWRAFCQA
jgi:hypothetical protein